MSLRSFGFLLVAGLILAMNLSAQLTVSTLRGTATDPAGAVIVNAHVTVVQLATNLTREINESRF